MKLQHTITEGKEVSFDSLDRKIKNQIISIQKVVGGKRTSIFSGVHGMIVTLTIPGTLFRLGKNQLQGLVKNNVRWIETKEKRNELSVGF